MSVPQYNRFISLKIGGPDVEGIDLSDLRIRFSVRRGDLSTPNSADIRVYNVSAETARKSRLREFERVVLQAGYPGNYGTIFDGTIKQVRRGRESQTDTYLDITAADGDSAYNFAVTSVTLAAGASPSDQINAVMADLEAKGVRLGELPNLPNTRLPRGKVIFGMTRNHLDNLGRTTDISWSIQDGQLTLIPNTAYLPGEAVVLNAETGMVGLPEQTQNGITVKALLNPGIRIGRVLQINNSSIQLYRYGLALSDVQGNQWVKQSAYLDADGFYRPIVVNHYGDSRGNDWYTDVICLAIDATLPPGLIRYSESPGGVGAVGSVRPYG